MIPAAAPEPPLSGEYEANPLLNGKPLYPLELGRTYWEQGYWTTDTFARFADDTAARFAENTAVVGTDKAGRRVALSYQQLADAAAAAGSGFADQGISAGDAVVVQLPNIVEYVVVILGLFRIGAVPIFALPAHRRAEITHFIEVSGACGYITAGKVGGFDYREIAAEVDDRVTVVIADNDSKQWVNIGDIVDVHNPAPAGSVPAEVHPENLALIQLSGGTTGVPKLIPRSHAAYHYSVRASAEICGLDEDSRLLAVLPAAHNFTMSSPGILGVLWAGGTVVLAPNASPRRSFELIEAEGVTIAPLVPPMAMAWLRAARTTTSDLSSLQVVQVGGAKFTESAARQFIDAFDVRLQQVFGMAEGLVNYTRDEDPLDIVLTTQGRPISDADEVRVLADDDAQVAAGEVGRLFTRGPYTIHGYLGGVDADSFTEDGFYGSGDLVRQLPSGHLVVEGRVKDQINRGGEKFSAEEVENHLIAHPDVSDAVVVGVPDKSLGERSCAVVITDADLSTKDIRAFVRDRGVAAYKVPDIVEVRREFPLTGVGKVSRRELRKLVLEAVQQG
ncbi:AMP-binding protein [Corynebacterium sp. TAE3-ERU12]|uniref:(2,3-dihydroxybenzoyl)adenylate synthase n=1 Tax=Corynebacterium sp. TAE3-ERU12 TaxID=2849491 RepID=UPI001C44BDA1|nr:AMP-binding protein [Corynebacterium sp. TAE3-ERU12]MBV7294634.1 AMP-binding protein [Corynebacterium sp. TAE3-ERU12]